MNERLIELLTMAHPSQFTLVLKAYLAGAHDFTQDFEQHSKDCLELREGWCAEELHSFELESFSRVLKIAAGGS